MNKIYQKFQHDLAAIFYCSLAFFLAIALGSFNPGDPSFNSIGSGNVIHNLCGYTGSFLADILLQSFGLAAWGFVLGLALMGYESLKKNDVHKVKMLWGSLLLVSVASLISLHFPEKFFFSNQIASGGWLGRLITHGLIQAFHFTGVAILLWSMTSVLLIFFTEKSIIEFFEMIFGFSKFLVVKLNEFSEKIFSLKSNNKVSKKNDELYKHPSTETKDSIKPSKFKWNFLADQKPKEFKKPNEKDEVVKTESIKTEQLEDPEEDTELFQDSEKESPQLVLAPERRRVQLKTKVERRIENWKLPELNLLEDPPASRVKSDPKEIEKKAQILTDKLSQFNVTGRVQGAKPGPAVTMYEFKPSADVKISKITELADDLSLALSSESVRIIAPIPGRDVVGIETSNAQRETVYLKDILASEEFWSDKNKLPLALGRQADGDSRVVDLRKMPHLLVAGTTGSGKSVFVVGCVTGLLFRHSPKSLRLILIDPKQVDLAVFSDVPHLLMPPIREARKAVTALKWAIREMDKRYRSMSRFGCRGLEQFNETVEKLNKTQTEEHEKTNLDFENANKKQETYYYTPQAYIVIVVEEFGDLMAVDKVNVEQSVVRLAQMARACGIHLILAMQSPRKDVVTGLIKTNIPGRISFKVASKMDSRIILDDSGAERLLAQGDMLFLAPGVSKPQRHHGPWISEKEISEVMSFWSNQGEPQYDPLALKALEGSGGGFDFGSGSDSVDPLGEPEEQEYDEMYDQLLAWVSTQKEVSASLLQRRFKLGYPRAARLIETFEAEGVVGPAQGSKPRQVLINSYQEAE